VREYLREGDCTDMVISSDGNGVDAKSIVQAIRSSEAILVPVINLKNDGSRSHSFIDHDYPTTEFHCIDKTFVN